MEANSTYVPQAPYMFKGGKHVGQVLESLVIDNYSFVDYMYRQLNSAAHASQNDFHKHLNWLVRTGENLETVIDCPFCGVRKAKYFWVDGYYLVDRRRVCCDDEVCKNHLRHCGGSLLPFKLSSLRFFSKAGKTAKDKVKSLFRAAFDMPASSNPGAVLQFFQTRAQA